MLSLLFHALAAAAFIAVPSVRPPEPEQSARIELLFGDNGARPSPPAAPAAPQAHDLPTPPSPAPAPRFEAASRPGTPAIVEQVASSDPGVRMDQPDPSTIPARDDPGNNAPAYPDEAWRNRQQGTVLLRLHIDREGQVTRLERLQSSGYAALDEAAETTLAHWRFLPALRDGHAVASYRDQPIRFVLQ